MSRHEDRFSSTRERQQFNRQPQPYSRNPNNDNKHRPQAPIRAASNNLKVLTSSSNSTTNTNQTNKAKPSESQTQQASVQSNVKTEPTASEKQATSTKASPQGPPKPSTTNQHAPDQHGDGKKRFTGRCRLFFGNIPISLTEQEFIDLIKPYGEYEDLFLNAKKGFGFVKLETRAAAEACKNGLDGYELQTRTLRVRFATHSAALKVKQLSPHCTNEALAAAFSIFGEVERAVVVVDDRGKSQCTGIVEYSRRSAYMKALDTITNGVFLISKSLRPVCVEPLDQKDEEDGLPEKYALKTPEWMEEMSIGPRVAEIGSYEYDVGMKWKELESIEADKKQALEEEMAQKRLEMELDVEALIHEHKANMLRQDMMRRQAELNALESQRRHREEQKRQELEMRRMQMLQQNEQMGRKVGGGPPVPRTGAANGVTLVGGGEQELMHQQHQALRERQQQQVLRERQQQMFRDMQQLNQQGQGAARGPQSGRPMIPPPQPPNLDGGGLRMQRPPGPARMGGGALLANPEMRRDGNRGGVEPMAQRASRFDQPPAAMQGGGQQGIQQRPMNNMQQLQQQQQQNNMFAQGGMGPGDPKRARRF